MINLNRIRTVAGVQAIKKDLEDFLSNPMVPTVYKTEYGWSENDYAADREDVIYLLEKVEQRIKSLTRLEAREGQQRNLKSVSEASPVEA